MRNFIYLSKRKIDLYYPQIEKSFRSEQTAKVGFKAAGASAEYSFKNSEGDSYAAKAIIIDDYLQKNKQIGTVISPNSWFGGVLSAGSIIDGRSILFGSIVGSGASTITVCLTASLEHMIGYEYVEREREWSNGSHTVGPSRSRVFRENSNSVDFAFTLSAVTEAFHKFKAADEILPDTGQPSLTNEGLTDEEWQAFNHWKWANKSLSKIYPNRSLFESTNFRSDVVRWCAAKLLVNPALGITLGSKKSIAKRSALQKRGASISYNLSKRDLYLLRAIRDTAQACSGYYNEVGYEFIANNLLEGEIDGKKVLFGSPLYLALTR